MKIKGKISLLIVLCLLTSMFAGIGTIAFAGDTALAVQYKFDGDTKDSSGNGNDGVVVGNITYVDGPLGKAAVFDGNSYIEVNDSDTLDFGKEFSFSVWLNDNIKPSTESQGIFTKLGNDYNDSSAYGLGETSMFPFVDRFDADTNICSNGCESDKKLESHKWILLTVTYDGSLFKFYQNGVLVSTKASGGTTVIQSKGKLQIGKLLFADKDNFYDGRMDDLRIYNRMLSEQEIKGLYGEALSGPGKDLVERPDRMIAYFSFDKDANDYSGFNNNGTAIGNITYVNSIATKGARFNGTSYIDVKDSDTLQVDQGFTMSGWFKLDNVKEEQALHPIIQKLQSSVNIDNAAYSVYVDTNNYYQAKAGYRPNFGAYCFNYNNNIIGNDFSVYSESSMVPDAWAMLTATFDGNNIKLYMNGNLIYVSELATEDTIVHSKGKLVIGKLLGNKTTYFTRGIMDELRLYNYPLDEAAVKKLVTLKDGISMNLPAGVSELALKAKGTFQIAPKVMAYTFAASETVPGTGADNYVQAAATAAFTYKSLNTKFASVDANGKVRAVAKGKTSIQISCGELIGYLTVNVQ